MNLDLYDLRRREVQALGAALSCRNWHMMETAYNSLRDKLDNAGFHIGAASTAEAASGAGEREMRAALQEIVANDDAEATIDDLVQHDRNAGYLSGVRDCADIARAALASLPPATDPAIPDGWKLVPVEQLEVADDAWPGLKQTQLAASEVGVEIAQSLREGYGLNLTLALRALAAAPTIPATGEVDDPNDLRPWGYAPGEYVFRCRDCPADPPFEQRPLGDKRSWRCKPHAEAARDASGHAATEGEGA